MNKTVKLVNEWGEFEKKHPNGSIADFCRNYLAKNKKIDVQGQLVGGVVPLITGGLLLKIIGRIHKLNSYYVNLALKETDLNQIEEFGVLLSIKQEKNPRKTDVIYANLLELSSGTEMLARLIKRELIKEYNDKEDKRSKRLEVTPKGDRAIKASFERIKKVVTMMLQDLSEDDQKLCIHFLKDVEIKFSEVWHKHRGKNFDEIYKDIVP